MSIISILYWAPCILVLICSIIARFGMGIPTIWFINGVFGAFIPVLNIILAVICVSKIPNMYRRLKSMIK